eukprot:6415934-Prymnesium_polylepis.1
MCLECDFVRAGRGVLCVCGWASVVCVRVRGLRVRCRAATRAASGVGLAVCVTRQTRAPRARGTAGPRSVRVPPYGAP